MFDWDRFKKGKIKVILRTEQLAKDFYKECKKRRIDWSRCDYAIWNEGGIVYKYYTISNSLVWNGIIDDGQESVEWKGVNCMKELTFKEVIANIKEGEVWESAYSIVSKLENRIDIEVSGNCKSIGIGDTVKFKLRRKEYTFEEAFKALEEGEEIESVISAYRIKKLTDGRFRISQKSQEFYTEKEGEVIITLQEIQGGWYIND